MKRVFILLLTCMFLFTGCNAFDGQYVRITPHTIQSNKMPAELQEAEGYLDLRNILSHMVSSGTETGVIVTKNYPEELLKDGMATAKRYICYYDPIGAYAVEDLNYEIGTKNGEPAVAVNISYLHSRSDIRNISRLSGIADVETTLLRALENLDARKVMLIPDYKSVDIPQMVQNMAQNHPDRIMECPNVTCDLYGLGTTRLLEVSFAYENTTDAQRQMRTQVKAVFDSASLYVSGDGSENQKYAQLYSFLMDRFPYQIETSITPSYSLLRHGVGDRRAFASVYAAMCRNAGLECLIVTGTRNAEPWTWNIICENGVYYHLDLIRCKDEDGFLERTDAAMGGYVWDYSAYPVCGGNPEGAVPEE